MSEKRPRKLPDLSFNAGCVLLPRELLWFIPDLKRLALIAKRGQWKIPAKALAALVQDRVSDKYYLFTKNEVQQFLSKVASSDTQGERIVAILAEFPNAQVPTLGDDDTPNGNSVLITRGHVTGAWMDIDALPPDAQLGNLLHDQFMRVPIEPGRLIKGATGLKEFIDTGKKVRNRPDKPFVIYLSETQDTYVMDSLDLRTIARHTTRRDDGTFDIDSLKETLRERARTQAAPLSSRRNPEEISAVLSEGRPTALWLHRPQMQQTQSTRIHAWMSDERLLFRNYSLDASVFGNVVDARIAGPFVDGYAPAPIAPTFHRTPHLDLNVAEPLQLGTAVTLRVYADTQPVREGEAVEEISLPATSGVNEFPVQVWLVMSEHFELLDPISIQTLLIKRDQLVAEPVDFKVRVKTALPAGSSLPLVSAMFSYNGRACGRVARHVVIASAPSLPAALPVAPVIRVEMGARQPDLTIDIRDPDRSLRSFDVLVTCPLLDAYKDGVAGKWKLNDVSSKIVTNYFEQFTNSATTGASLAALKGAGKRLFESAPDVFKDAFWAIIDQKKELRTISIVSEEPFIPWELMIPWQTGGVRSPREALGVEFAVARWLRDDHLSAPQIVQLKDSCVFQPNYPGPRTLKTAAAEAQMVVSRFPPGFRVIPAMFDGFRAAMKQGGATVVHFICHGADKTGGVQAIYLEDDGFMTSVQMDGLDELAAAFASKKPLVFLNACEVGRTVPGLVGIGGFAKTFIDAGASCVIAPLWSVRDTIAHEVATKFYDAIHDHPERTFAEILRVIRKSAYDEAAGGEDTYAAYCFYGDPHASRVGG
jgi:hypothetical protein